jgi:hypothetical protein
LKTSPANPNPNPCADGSDDPLRAQAAVQVALDRRDNGGDACAARDAETARAAGADSRLAAAGSAGFGRVRRD